ncbi:MAG: phosphoethanolamine--lipid A transferase [Pigmentiphaga sp.]|uniref:phosphoethanolamine transferase n=1 Tax=Pigmentiphaga sp. TaxID=1977564 RepID=UPI0029BCC280|nr:phosphoethanolamine--lipid A transferase [Pigmentiphaga sp.]MDX3905498.1 phosphoethanolamine--lipid A transferase [Pigmentiphaga sp.]
MRSTRLSLLTATGLVAFYNVPVWKEVLRLVPCTSLEAAAFYFSFAVLMWSAFALLLTLCSFRPVFKPLLTLLFPVSAVVAYFMGTYGVAIDSVMVQNLFETDLREAGAFAGPGLLAYLAVLGVMPVVLLWTVRIDYTGGIKGLLSRLMVAAACLVTGAAMLAGFYSTYAPLFREHRQVTQMINPTNYLYAFGKYVRHRWGTTARVAAVAPLGTDAHRSPVAARARKALVVFVLGETARADHFGLIGYGRDTTPELSGLGVLGYTRVSSCGTSTAVSVPCLFSGLGRAGYTDGAAWKREGLLDVLQHAGIDVYWRENNSDCKGTCVRVAHDSVMDDPERPFCGAQGCLDEALLVGLQAYVDAHPGDIFIVLHTMGSHGPAYYQRYPPAYERFTPVCRTNRLDTCTHESLVNAYDNTIAYTDHFLAQVVLWLQRQEATRDTAMVYVSDHGESLGENGIYLHAAPYAFAPRAQTHVPMLIWLAQAAVRDWRLDMACLAAGREQAYSHDNLFHTFLGLFDVRSAVYRQELDVFAPCRKPPPALQGRSGSS